MKPLWCSRVPTGHCAKRQLARALPALPRRIEHDLVTGFAVSIDARINRICEDMVDGDVTRVDRFDLGAVVALQREGQAFGSEPERRCGAPSQVLRSARKDGTDRGQDGFIGMEAHFALLLAPDKAHWKAAAQFAASGLVAISAQEPRPQHMQLGLAHGALELKQQPVVEQRRMIDAVGIADEGIGEAAQVEQAIPIGIVAGEPRDFEAEHKTNVTERDLCGEPLELRVRQHPTRRARDLRR